MGSSLSQRNTAAPVMVRPTPMSNTQPAGPTTAAKPVAPAAGPAMKTLVNIANPPPAINKLPQPPLSPYLNASIASHKLSPADITDPNAPSSILAAILDTKIRPVANRLRNSSLFNPLLMRRAKFESLLSLSDKTRVATPKSYTDTNTPAATLISPFSLTALLEAFISCHRLNTSNPTKTGGNTG